MNNRWEGGKNRAKPLSLILAILQKKNKTDQMKIPVLMMELGEWGCGHETSVGHPPSLEEVEVNDRNGGMRGDRRMI